MSDTWQPTALLSAGKALRPPLEPPPALLGAARQHPHTRLHVIPARTPRLSLTAAGLPPLNRTFGSCRTALCWPTAWRPPPHAFSSDASSHATSRRGRSPRPRGHVENTSQANGWRSGGHALGQPRALLHEAKCSAKRRRALSQTHAIAPCIRLQFCGSKPITTARRTHVVIPAKGLTKPAAT